MQVVYKVLDCETAKELEDQINIYAEDGWKTSGDVHVTTTQYKIRYTQRMSKEIPETFCEREERLKWIGMITSLLVFFGLLAFIGIQVWQRL